MLNPGFRIRRLDPVKPADVIVYRDGDRAVAVDKYGNKIDESTDHATVIQEAIDRASMEISSCGDIRCDRQVAVDLAGEFIISSKLVMRGGVILRGPATLRLDYNGPFIDNIGNPAKHCGVIGVIFDGVKYNTTGIQGYFVRCVFAFNLIRYLGTAMFLQEGSGVNRIVFNTIIQVKKGIEVRGSDNMIAFNDIGNVLNTSLSYYDPDYPFQDVGIYLNNASTDYNADDNKIIGNEIWGFTKGIYQYDPNQKIGNNIIDGNMIHRNGLMGIHIVGGRGATITGNTIRSNGELQSSNDWERAGITVSGGAKATIIGNEIMDQYQGYQLYSLYVGDAEVWLGPNRFSLPSIFTSDAVVHKFENKFLSDCANLPSSGEYKGETYICYDSANSKWVLKVWDGSAWQTIG